MKYITYALITDIGIITISLIVTIDYFNGVNKDLTSRIEALETQIIVNKNKALIEVYKPVVGNNIN